MANQPDPPPAVLFDIDGTLVDSNYLHIHAWCRAFNDVGIAVESWRIHRSIGMDGARLIKSLSGDADDDVQERAKDLHLQYFKDSSSLLRRLPGARELLEQVRTLGLQVVLASSAGEDELSLLRGVLDCDDLVCRVACRHRQAEGSSDGRVDHAVYVGDAVWDVVACGRAGVPAIGLLSGGVSRGELENAGAEAVFDNPRDLLDHIGSTRITALSGLSVS